MEVSRNVVFIFLSCLTNNSFALQHLYFSLSHMLIHIILSAPPTKVAKKPRSHASAIGSRPETEGHSWESVVLTS